MPVFSVARDYLIVALGVASLVLGMGWVGTSYVARSTADKLRTESAMARATNAEQKSQLDALQTEYNELIARNQADLLRMKALTDEMIVVRSQLTVEQISNEALRAALAEERPDVKAYLDASVPCVLAVSMWPDGAYACQD